MFEQKNIIHKIPMGVLIYNNKTETTQIVLPTSYWQLIKQKLLCHKRKNQNVAENEESSEEEKEEIGNKINLKYFNKTFQSMFKTTVDQTYKSELSKIDFMK